MDTSRNSSGYYQAPLPILHDGLTFPDFLKIRPPSASSIDSIQSRYEVPKLHRNSESRPLTHPFLPPKPSFSPPKTPTQQNHLYEGTSSSSSRMGAYIDNKRGSYVRSIMTNSTQANMPTPRTDSGAHIYQKPYDPSFGTIGSLTRQLRPPSLPANPPPVNIISAYESALNNFLVLGNQRQSSETSYAHQTLSDRMRSTEFSPIMHNELATSLMGSSNDSRDDRARCFQTVYSHGRRPSSSPKSIPSSRLFNAKTSVIYFVCMIILLVLLAGSIILKSSKQYAYSNSDLIKNTDTSSEYTLEFGRSSDIILPSRQIVYLELAIQHPINLALLFNISDPQSRFVVYARQTLPPTPTAYAYRRIITAEHLHHRTKYYSKRSISDRQMLEETQVRNSVLTLDDIQAGKWYFGFLNDNLRPLEINLIPVSIPNGDHEIKSHGCRFDCFGKGTCVKNRCVCFPGFAGNWCEETLCPILCSNNGVFSNGRCVCHANYRGPVCDETVNTCLNGQCESIESQVSEALNAHRPVIEPILTSSPKTTELITTTATIDKSHCNSECEEHGNCLDNVCICEPGWHGDDCQFRGCENNCNSNGACQSINDQYRCFCNNTHFGPNCEYPLELECSNNIDDDNDGLVDCFEPECCSSPYCSNHQICIGDLQKFAAPDRNQIKPEVDFKKQVSFLLNSELGQKYTNPIAFDADRISVVRGRVLSERAGPLNGVRVSNVMNTKEGFTYTRSASDGGSFNLVCNGGTFVRLSFLRLPFGAVERLFYVPSNEIIDVGDIFIDETRQEFNNKDEQCRSFHISHKFKPKLSTLFSTTPDNFNVKLSDGSRIDAETGSLEVRSSIEKTENIQLVYNSDRLARANSMLYIQLLNKDVPLKLEVVHLSIQIAGRIFKREFLPKSNLQYDFAWDRLNVFGQSLIGSTNARVEIAYEYKNCSQNLVTFSENIEMKGVSLTNTHDFGLWTLNIQHNLDIHNKIIERGDGQRVYLNKAPPIVRTLLSNSTQSLNSLLILPDGSIVFGDHKFIKRLSANSERVDTLLELSMDKYADYYMALNFLNNSVYLSLNNQVIALKALERVRNPKKNYEVVAGCESDCSNGDNKAKSMKFTELKGLSFDKYGGFYIIDGRSIRYINRDGELHNLVLVTDWHWTFECPHKFRLELLNLEQPINLIVDYLTQDLFVLDSNAIYRIDVKAGVAKLVAGNMHNCDKEYQQADKSLNFPQQIALDSHSNYLYFTESDKKRLHRIRRVSTNGGEVEEFAGRIGNCDCNPTSCPCDELSDKRLQLARDALFHNLNGINVDQHGRIYVVDAGNLKIKVIEPMNFKLNNQIYQINSPDSDEIYEFDSDGRHIQTKSLFDEQTKFLFSYSNSDGRLVNIKMRHTNLTFSTEDSNIVIRDSQSHETTIQTRSIGENDYSQIYAISTPDGVHSMFDYTDGRLINKTQVRHKTAVILYDSNGQATSIEEVDKNRHLQFQSPIFDDAGILQTPIVLNDKEIGRLDRSDHTLNLIGNDEKLLKRSNGFEFDKYGQHYVFERSDHPFSSDSFTVKHRLGYTKNTRDISQRYEIQTFHKKGETHQIIKLNGQKLITKIFNPNKLTQKIQDASGKELLILKFDLNNNLIRLRFDNVSAEFQWNEIGQIERVDWMNRTLLNLFDDRHQLAQQVIKTADTEISRSFHDFQRGLPSKVEFNNGAEFQIDYEENGRLKSIQALSGEKHTFEIGTNGEIIRTLPSGSQLKALYNFDEKLEEFSSLNGKHVKWLRGGFGRSLSDFTYKQEHDTEKLKSLEYDDVGRVTKATFNDFTLSSITYAYDIMGRTTKIGNSMIIQKGQKVEIIHPNFDLTFQYTADGRLSQLDYTNSKGPKKISAKFDYNSLSMLNNSVWSVDGKAESEESVTYSNGDLNSFNLNGKEYKIGYKNQTYTTNEIGWIIQRGNYSFVYDALGQIVELTDKPSNTTFEYIYDEKQRLVQSKTKSIDHPNIKFYYGISNNPDQLSHFSVNDEKFYSIHYYNDRPFLLEQLNGPTFVILSDSLGSIRKIVDESGAVIESRIYTPFGQSNVSKISDNILPIGYMGFIEINGIVFVYDKANQVTRPLNLQTGRFQTSSFMSVKPVIDVFNPNLEIDLFYFHHGRSVSNIFPTSTEEWFKMAGIPNYHLLNVENLNCMTYSFCLAHQASKSIENMLNFDHPNLLIHNYVPIL